MSMRGVLLVLVGGWLLSGLLSCGGADDRAPWWPEDASLEAVEITSDSVLLGWSEAEDDHGVMGYELYRDDTRIAELDATTFETTIDGLSRSTDYRFQIQACDAAGNVSTGGPALDVQTGSGLPPDPASVASEIDRSAFGDFYSRVKFLWDGDRPVVWGADATAFEARRLVVLRGRVLDAQGEPLSFVTVRVAGHPEYGHTLTREDGAYDLAANGGGYVVLRFEQAGLLPVQRKLRTPWRDFVAVPDVVMIAADSLAHSLSLDGTGGAMLAAGSAVEDDDGARQAVLRVPAGARARAVMPDGSERELGTGSLRITEYTQGTLGPQRMPARMPSNIAYTYAVELSLDELTADEELRFDTPVVFYADMFLGFPAGTPAPAGYYDPARAVWVPAESGIVIERLADGGLDADGDGQADSAEALAALGMDEAERAQIAERYEPGQRFIRLQLDHFSTYDVNWGFSLPQDADGPSRAPSQGNGHHDCEEGGSVIDVQDQGLGEDVALIGLPFGLHYRSERMTGYGPAYGLRIPLRGPEAPASLKAIQVELDVAGRHFHYDFDPDPTPGQAYDLQDFAWDGRDAYGRLLQGAQPVKVRIGYIFDGVYQANERFGYSGNGADITASQTRQEIGLWLEWKGSIGALDATGLGLGGWTLGVQHAYDPAGRVLYLGSGEKRSARELEPRIRSVAGGGQVGPLNWGPEGHPALEANFPCSDVAVAPDGSLVLGSGDRIVRVDPAGIAQVVAGGGTDGEGEGIAARDAYIWNALKVDIDALGAIYFADTWDHRVRKVSPDGKIYTLGGRRGEFGYEGDGGPVSGALFFEPRAVLVAEDGSVYIVDRGNCVLRRVGTDGLIHTLAGQPGAWSYEGQGDGGPAIEALLDQRVNDLAEGLDGSIYLLENAAGRVRRIDRSGTIDTVAGGGAERADGVPATEALIEYPESLTVGPDGSLYIETRFCIRKVGPDGRIRTLAGTGEPTPAGGDNGDGGPASKASFRQVLGMALDPEGRLYLADSEADRLRVLEPPLPGRVELGEELVVPSAGGSEVYVFDAEGKHLQTLHGLTGGVLWTLEYGAGGLLEAVADGDGKRTEITRSAGAIQIAPPFAGTTELTLGPDGLVEQIRDPLGRETRLWYRTGGLLERLQDATGREWTYQYDSQGRLVRDSDPAGGYKELLREEDAESDSVTVELRTAEGRSTYYRKEQQPDGTWRMTNTFPGGLVNRLDDQGGTELWLSLADMSTRETSYGPDPRFGMSAPVAEEVVFRTPAGIELAMAHTREVVTSGAGLFDYESIQDEWTQNGRTSTVEYAQDGRVLRTQTPAGRVFEMRLDEQGRLVESSIQDSGIWPVEASYDEHGRIVELAQGEGEARRVATMRYDASGFVDSLTDPVGRTVRFERDAAGQVLVQTLPDGRQIGFAWDEAGMLVGLTPPGRPEHVMGYTQVDELELYDPPEVGLAEHATRYEYNLDRDLTKVLRPDGVTVELSYDAAGRLETLTHPHDAVTLTHNDRGHVERIATRDDEVVLDYTHDGPLVTSETWSGPFFGRVSREYNADLQVERLKLTGQAGIDYLYDDDGLLISAGELQIGRDPTTGLVSTTELGHVTTEKSYDSFGELASISASYEGAPIYEAIYTRDLAGRITGKTETVQGVTTSYEYRYDQAGRLFQVIEDGLEAERYTYDENSNRLSAYYSGESFEGTYDAQDRMTSYGQASYTYTANGELETKTEGGETTTFDYDALGNLRTVSLPDGRTIEYIIDGRNRRVGKKVDGVLVQGFVYLDQLNPAAELDGSGDVVSEFVYGTRVNVPEYIKRDGHTYRVVADHLGSPRLVVNVSTGNTEQLQRFDAFGRLQNTPSDFQPFGFAGGIWDADTGLVRFGARDYDPATGRWTTKDQIGFAARSSNLFGYSTNDPINLVDTDGLRTQIIITIDSILGIEFGSHAAVRIDNGGGEPVLYNPNGYYPVKDKYGGPAGGSGGWFSGEAAELGPFIDWHLSEGSDVVVLNFDTTPCEEQQIWRRIKHRGQPGYISCAINVAFVLRGIGPFRGLEESTMPGNLFDDLLDILGTKQ